jgi:putative acetyltransferase
VTNGVIIRPEREADFDAIASVHRAAFGRDDEGAIAERARELGDDVADLSLVAELETRVVGHVLISRARLDGRGVLALGPIGVVPELQRQGIGGALMRETIARARAAGEPLIVLLGHPSYYPRFGFVPASRFGIRPPFDVRDDVFMALELHPGAAAGGGAFSYSSAFDAAVD